MAFLGFTGCLSQQSHGVFLGHLKIGFIGMRIKNNITTHGLAINLLNDAAIFNFFSPCNISNLTVSSICKHIKLGESLSFYGEKFCEFFVVSLQNNT